MLSEVCHEINNWFCVKKFFGSVRIIDGKIDFENSDLHDENGRSLRDYEADNIPVLQNGQYFRIVGSVFNDGVHRNVSHDLTDETYNGALWAMAVPPDFLSLVGEIEKFQADYGAALSSPYSAESFGGYSYQKEAGGGAEGGESFSWRNAFGARLNKWRKVRGIV